MCLLKVQGVIANYNTIHTFYTYLKVQGVIANYNTIHTFYAYLLKVQGVIANYNTIHTFYAYLLKVQGVIEKGVFIVMVRKDMSARRLLRKEEEKSSG